VTNNAFKGKKNIYRCDADSCQHEMVTIDTDGGTTPFITACPRCKANTVSRFYRVPQDLTPTHEWYSPTDRELEVVLLKFANPHQKQYVRDHVKMGGLLLRELNR
jgi:hypothetical protein